VVVTREPGGSPRSEVLREMLLAGTIAPFGPDAEALVFAIARAEHVAGTIRPALQAGAWVISDRFHDSTWAYQGAAGVPAEQLARLDSIALGDLRPDLTLILDLPVETGLQRAVSRNHRPDRFEADALQLHQERRQAFLAIAAREPTRCAVIDARAEPAAVAQAVAAAVTDRLGAALAGAL
jgi:dTMP kinase